MTVATAVAHEAHAPHGEHTHYTSTGLEHRKIAVWAFIGSECMLFASLISTYLIYKGRSKVGPFPHEWSCKTSNAVAKTREPQARKPARQPSHAGSDRQAVRLLLFYEAIQNDADTSRFFDVFFRWFEDLFRALSPGFDFGSHRLTVHG